MALGEGYKVIIASDVGAERDGIGIEVYFKNKLILEIFRDDTKKNREVSFFQKDVPLEILEECIGIFKKEIPMDYQE